ncbi:MAG: citryl-CoA lyase [Betaproteobacteria bacterium]|nr:citryl-CoA lyase [Betaproteobacteria bacterium]
MERPARKQKPLKSNMGWSTPDQITVKGFDFTGTILGKLSLGDMAWLEIKGTLPTPQQSAVFNALLVTLVEHGMTPMAMATRLVYLGAPESLQAAVAAGLCGMGSVFAGTAEGSARMVQDALRDPEAKKDLPGLAVRIVADYMATKRSIPGIGHPLHKPIDPRTPVLFDVAAKNGYSGDFVKLMQLVAAEAERVRGRSLPVNATGAIGSIASELGIDWRLCRGIAVIGRAVGLVGHIAEELQNPIASEMWARAEEETSALAREGT